LQIEPIFEADDASIFFFMDIQASVWLTWPTLFQCKDSEIAPRRRVPRQARDVVSPSNHGGRGEGVVKSNLCELCPSISLRVVRFSNHVSVVN